MTTLRLKPKPYDFAGELARKQAHDIRFAKARDDSGFRPICPYCYRPPGGARGSPTCGCSP